MSNCEPNKRKQQKHITCVKAMRLAHTSKPLKQKDHHKQTNTIHGNIIYIQTIAHLPEYTQTGLSLITCEGSSGNIVSFQT